MALSGLFFLAGCAAPPRGDTPASDPVTAGERPAPAHRLPSAGEAGAARPPGATQRRPDVGARPMGQSVEERLAARRRSLQWTLGRWAARERENGQRLAGDLDYIRGDIQRDAERFPRTARGAAEYFGRDFERFEQRQDDYRDKLWEILRGDLENAEPWLLMWL